MQCRKAHHAYVESRNYVSLRIRNGFDVGLFRYSASSERYIALVNSSASSKHECDPSCAPGTLLIGDWRPRHADRMWGQSGTQDAVSGTRKRNSRLFRSLGLPRSTAFPSLPSQQSLLPAPICQRYHGTSGSPLYYKFQKVNKRSDGLTRLTLLKSHSLTLLKSHSRRHRHLI